MPFEDIIGTKENAGNQHFFSNILYHIKDINHATDKLSFVNTLNLVQAHDFVVWLRIYTFYKISQFYIGSS